MRYRLLALVVLLPLIFPCQARSEGAMVRTIHFVEEANWPPFTPNQFGKAKEGLALALMQAIFSRLGIEVEIELLPQTRMLHLLKTGARDGATVISENAERRDYLEFSDPLLAKRGYLYYRADRQPPLVWHAFKDLKGLRIGVVSGHNYGDEFAAAVTSFELAVVTVSQERQLFTMLMAGRIDCLLSIDLTAGQYLQEPAFEGKVTHAEQRYYDKNYHIAFSKRSEARKLLPKVNAVIGQMRHDGTLDRLLAPYRVE